MRGEEFVAWMTDRGLNDSSAARTLEISRTTVIKYKNDGAPLVVALACAALSNGLAPWAPRLTDAEIARAAAAAQLQAIPAALKGR